MYLNFSFMHDFFLKPKENGTCEISIGQFGRISTAQNALTNLNPVSKAMLEVVQAAEKVTTDWKTRLGCLPTTSARPSEKVLMEAVERLQDAQGGGSNVHD